MQTRQLMTAAISVLALALSLIPRPLRGAQAEPRRRGHAEAVAARPTSFPYRIWAACDFEGATPDYAWFGVAESKDIPPYLGNATSLRAEQKSYANHAALMAGINPVPGPRMGHVNKLCLRYSLTGATHATFQHFSLSSNDNNHIHVTGLTKGRWSDLTLNFTRDAQRNDGTPGVPFKDGERMDDLKVFVGKPGDGNRYDLLLDDIIFFSEHPDLPPEKEPFPNRVIFLAAFDTGTDAKSRAKYWPGDMDIVTDKLPGDSWWGVARAVPRKDGARSKWIRLQIAPERPVGAHTRLRFRYHLTGASAMTVQIFDATDNDNRHVRLTGLKQNAWTSQYVDFTNDARRNDGTNTPFAAGHKVDDLFFFVDPQNDAEVELLIDEVVLYDAGTR